MFFRTKEQDQEKKDTEKELKEEKDKDKNNKPSYIKYVLPFFGLLVVIQLIWFVGGSKKTDKTEVVLNEDKKTQLETKNKEETKTQKIKNTTEKAEIQIADLPIEDASLFNEIKKSVFTEDLLIKSSEVLEIYFKVDKKSTITKILKPFVGFNIKAKNSIYLRFDDNKGDVQIFYNGVQIEMNSTFFFEKNFSYNNS